MFGQDYRTISTELMYWRPCREKQDTIMKLLYSGIVSTISRLLVALYKGLGAHIIRHLNPMMNCALSGPLDAKCDWLCAHGDR